MARLIHLLAAKLAIWRLTARTRWRIIRYALHAMPIAGAEDPPKDPPADPPKDPPADPPKDPPKEDDDLEDDLEDDPPPKDKGRPAPDDLQAWKQYTRKWERESKNVRKERDELAQKLKAREDADRSEQEKAIEEAEQRTRKDVTSSFETERRKDRLEVAATKIAAKGLKIGTGDDAKKVRFADPDDALLHLERDIRTGDLDPEQIFDANGRVRTDQLQEALTDLLARKPHLAADTGSRKVVAGTADAGKGAPTTTETTVEDQLKKIRRHKAA